MDLLRAFGRSWKLTCALGFTGACAAVAVVTLMVPPANAKYSTSALIRVEPGETLPGTPQARPELRDLRTQAELVKTPFVIRTALQAGPAADLPAVRANADAVLKRMATDLKVEAVSPQLLRVTLTGSDPDELPVLVDAIKETYLREVVNGEQTRRAKRKEFLEVAYRDCEKRLAEKRAALAPDGKGQDELDERLAFERFTLLQNELFRIEMDLHRSKLDLALAARPDGETEVPQAVVDELSEQDPVVQKLRTQLADFDARIARWEQVTTRPDAEEPYVALSRERSAVVGELDARKRLLIGRYAAKAAEERGRRAGQAQDRVTRLGDEEKLTRTLLVRGWDDFKLRAKGDQESRLRRYEIERLEGIAKQMLDELEGLRLEGGVLARTAAVKDAAEPAVMAASQQPIRLALAGLLPFALVAGVVVVWELRARRVYTPADVRAGLGLRVLGAVPNPARCPRAAATLGPRPDPVAQSADAIAAALHRDLGPGAPRVVVVTSAVPGEGKSTFARLLAAAAARAGRRTLLLDGDLYRPTVHRTHALPHGPGLGELLLGIASAADAIRPTTTEGLFVLPAGTVDDRVVGRLVRGGIGPVLAELRSSFDTIVLDSGPVLATSHPLLIARHADTVILASLSGVSRLPHVEDASRRLADLGLPLAGLVVNGTGHPGRYGYYAPNHDRNTPARQPQPV